MRKKYETRGLRSRTEPIVLTSAQRFVNLKKQYDPLLIDKILYDRLSTSIRVNNLEKMPPPQDFREVVADALIRSAANGNTAAISMVFASNHCLAEVPQEQKLSSEEIMEKLRSLTNKLAPPLQLEEGEEDANEPLQ